MSDSFYQFDPDAAVPLTAERIEALLNGASNRNLLYNWDFRNPVNQRGQSSYTGVGYTVDRWHSNTPQTVTPLSDKLTVANLENNYAQISQYVENPSKYAGLTVTLSFIGNKESGDVRASIAADGQTIGAVPLASTKQLTSLTVTLPETISSHLSVNFWCNAVASTYHLYCAKLEPGSASTLSNDPPADYGEELRKCQRYFRLWTTEAARTEALKDVGLMRLESPALGTISISGTTYYYASAEL